MTFVAQLSLADLDPSGSTGPTWGTCTSSATSSRSRSRSKRARCLRDPSHARGRRAERAPFRERYPRPAAVRQAGNGLTLPDEDAPADRGPLGLGFNGARSSDTEELWKLNKRLRGEQGWHHRAGQLFGWPTWQNDDNIEYLASLRGGQGLEWTLLLQTDALDAELYVVLPTADLAAARFDRAEATIEHD